jgi:predicted DNA-binding transcriptional regulator AlpA
VKADTELLTVPEVMARLKVSRSTVYDLIRTQRLAPSPSAAPAASPPTP